ncbi:hypothetical protein GGR57DRAFT_285952 [Xylariaceae sp. FL1272]|nr:hypothetical protein GGR57DRAFT_285952 [Xylariaceae sp. FL1272]
MERALHDASRDSSTTTYKFSPTLQPTRRKTGPTPFAAPVANHQTVLLVASQSISISGSRYMTPIWVDAILIMPPFNLIVALSVNSERNSKKKKKKIESDEDPVSYLASLSLRRFLHEQDSRRGPCNQIADTQTFRSYLPRDQFLRAPSSLLHVRRIISKQVRTEPPNAFYAGHTPSKQ